MNRGTIQKISRSSLLIATGLSLLAVILYRAAVPTHTSPAIIQIVGGAGFAGLLVVILSIYAPSNPLPSNNIAERMALLAVALVVGGIAMMWVGVRLHLAVEALGISLAVLAVLVHYDLLLLRTPS
jgi:hypothetical protein